MIYVRCDNLPHNVADTRANYNPESEDKLVTESNVTVCRLWEEWHI
jgi:hypothetical protein